MKNQIKSNQFKIILQKYTGSLCCEVRDLFILFFWCSNFPHEFKQRAARIKPNIRHAYCTSFLYSSTHQIRQWTQSCIILRFLSCQKMCVGRLIGRPLYFHRLLHYNGHRTNLLWYINIYIYIFHILQIWQKFNFHSCLQLPGDGANWTKTVFHCGLTGSCESIYSLTAMRQNGPWKIDTSKRPEKTRKDSLGVVASDNVHIWRNPCVCLLHLIMQNNVLPQAQHITVSMNGCGFAFSTSPVQTLSDYCDTWESFCKHTSYCLVVAYEAKKAQ